MRAILAYHPVDDSGSVISVQPAARREHARWFASGIVQVVNIEGLWAVRDSVDAVAVTFDDGL